MLYVVRPTLMGERVRNEFDGAFGATNRQSCEAGAKALSLMVNALQHLDSDPAIPAVIGARLQLAIDTLCVECAFDVTQQDIH